MTQLRRCVTGCCRPVDPPHPRASRRPKSASIETSAIHSEAVTVLGGLKRRRSGSHASESRNQVLGACHCGIFGTLPLP